MAINKPQSLCAAVSLLLVMVVLLHVPTSSVAQRTTSLTLPQPAGGHHIRRDAGHCANVNADTSGAQTWLPSWFPLMGGRPPWTPAWEGVHIDVDDGVWTGQDKEDKYLWENFFYQMRGGTYLEIGGLDGKLYSNTLGLNRHFAWRGLLIEPDPDNYAKMVKNRPADINVHAAVCKEPATVHFVCAKCYGGDGSISGVYEFMSDHFKNNVHKAINPETLPAVPCIPVAPLLGRFGMHHIDFFSLDVEGGEYEVLKGIDLDCISFSVIAVEADGTNGSKDETVRKHLATKGYVYHGHVVRNDWFVHSGFRPRAMPKATDAVTPQTP